MTEATPTKLCIIIVPSSDGDRLLEHMTEAGFSATRVGSSGGFLKRGSATVFSAIEESRVSELAAMLREHFPEMIEEMPVGSFPFLDDAELAAAAMVNVRVGGAVLFVLPLDQMVRV